MRVYNNIEHSNNWLLLRAHGFNQADEAIKSRGVKPQLIINS